MKDLIKKILKEEVQRTLNETTSIQPTDFCPPIEGALTPSHSGWYWGDDRGTHDHAGVDYKANEGDIIRAPYSGEIEYADCPDPSTCDEEGCGGTLVINHGEGIRTRYCHVSTFPLQVGSIVYKGQVVGKIGGDGKNKGNASGAHLHYEIHTDSTKKSKGKLSFSTSVDPESNGWLDNLDCSGGDHYVIDDEDIINNDEEKKHHDGEKPNCLGVLSTKEVKNDTLKLIKIYYNGFMLDDNGDVVHETEFFPDSIGNMDKGNINAKGIERYAKQNDLTDDGKDISITNNNIWVDCRLNNVVFNHIEDNDITYG